jgi:hypothetical protein
MTRGKWHSRWQDARQQFWARYGAPFAPPAPISKTPPLDRPPVPPKPVSPNTPCGRPPSPSNPASPGKMTPSASQRKSQSRRLYLAGALPSVESLIQPSHDAHPDISPSCPAISSTSPSTSSRDVPRRTPSPHQPLPPGLPLDERIRVLRDRRRQEVRDWQHQTGPAHRPLSPGQLLQATVKLETPDFAATQTQPTPRTDTMDPSNRIRIAYPLTPPSTPGSSPQATPPTSPRFVYHTCCKACRASAEREAEEEFMQRVSVRMKMQNRSPSSTSCLTSASTLVENAEMRIDHPRKRRRSIMGWTSACRKKLGRIKSTLLAKGRTSRECGPVLGSAFSSG